MRGHVRKQGPGRFALVVELSRDPVTGKRRQHWQTVRGSRAEADRELARVLHELDTGQFLDGRKTTLAQFLERWIAEKVSRRSPSTQDLYARVARRASRCMGTTALASLTPLEVEGFVNALLKDGLAPASARLYLTVFRGALNQALRWGAVTRNVASLVEPPSARRRKLPVPDAADLAEILAAVEDTRFYLPVLIAAATGLRRGEVLGLRWSDLSEGALTVGQQVTGRKERFAPPKTEESAAPVQIGAAITEALRVHRAEQSRVRLLMGGRWEANDLICCRDDGRPWHPSTFSTALKRHLAKSGLAFTFHSIRHNHASQLIGRGVPITGVSARLRHSSPSVTSRHYSHVIRTAQDAATEAAEEVIRGATRKREAG